MTKGRRIPKAKLGKAARNRFEKWERELAMAGTLEVEAVIRAAMDDPKIKLDTELLGRET